MPQGASAPIFSANGTNGAKNTVATFSAAGSYGFTVTIKDAANLTTTSTVNVTVNATPTTVSIGQPSSSALNWGGTQQFSATASDQFGNAISQQPITWSVTGAGNSISTGGLLTANAAAGTYTVTASAGGAQATQGVSVNAVVSGRSIFYNHTAWDGNDVTANAQDDAAIDTTKSALLPGQTATGANFTDFFNGVNGVMVDVGGLPTAVDPTGADFVFTAGNSADSSTWTSAPAPVSVVVRRGAGVGGSDRVELVWADGAIANEWLKVTVLANADTGLTSPDVFYFGNLVGDVSGNGVISGSDVSLAKFAVGTSATVSTAADINRNGVISGSDVSLVKLAVGGSPLTLFTA